MKLKHSLLTLLCTTSLFVASAQVDIQVSYVPLDLTDIKAEPILRYNPCGESAEVSKSIKLYPNITYQQISGIGGCFNEIGGEALSSLPEAQQQELLTSLFSNDGGGMFSFCRASIGSSDFGIDAYSFSEVADDYQMEHFSLEREKQYMLPYMQAAVAINPDLEIFGSPWSPPAWMKYNGKMDGGVEDPTTNKLIDSDQIYSAYALYFLKYIQEYAQAGIEIDRICIQNEQDISTKYPSCNMPVEQMAHFVANYLKPLFIKNEIDTQIWAGTFRTAGSLDGLLYASSPLFQKGFDGIGVQYTRSEYLADIARLAPGMKMMHTESACHNGDNSHQQAIGRFAEVARYINGGCENYAYWNMILNESGKSGWGWKQNSLVTIDRDAKSVIYNPDYAVVSLMSRFIRPGGVRIASFYQDEVITLSYDGYYIIITQNELDQPVQYNCNIEDKIISFEIPANSLNAIKITL